jgi:hypothetical protein
MSLLFLYNGQRSRLRRQEILIPGVIQLLVFNLEQHIFLMES